MPVKYISSQIKQLFSKLHFRIDPLREIRHELHLLAITLRNKYSPFRQKRARELRSLVGIKLHFGCGRNVLPGWINVDAYETDGIDYISDLRGSLPFASNSIRYIFSEHVFEHFERSDVRNILCELSRAMSSGAVLRIIVPDLDFYCKKYVEQDTAQLVIPVPGTTSCAEAINDVFNGHFHRFIYDFETLRKELEGAGFVNVLRTEYGQSDHKQLAMDARILSRSTGSLCVEATKPE